LTLTGNKAMSNQILVRRQMRLEEIEEWKRTARALGDRLGYFSSKAFDLCSTVGKEGVHAETVCYAVESLKSELERARERDPDRENPLHNLIYGLAECFGEMVESINEERRSELEPNQLDLGMDQQQFGMDQQQFVMDFNDDYQLLHVPKQEVIDLTDDISLPENSPDIELIAEEGPPTLDRQQPTEEIIAHISSRLTSPHLDAGTLDDQPGTSRQDQMDDGFQLLTQPRRRAMSTCYRCSLLNTPQSIMRASQTASARKARAVSFAPDTPAPAVRTPRTPRPSVTPVVRDLPHPCDHCERTFATPRGLQVHNYTHGRES
ncbi:hypothetical protein PENTCL1PPCAC_356, partial [Pristionchus entomophagus]